jgi:hypothetical protein
MDAYIDEAAAIYADFKHRLYKDDSFKELGDDDRLDFFQRRYAKFAKTFPIVIRYMVQLRRFSTRAFKKFIEIMKKKPYRSEDEFCKRQADYVKLLYMETTNTHNVKESQRVWKKTYEMLTEEIKAFKKAEEVVKKRLEESNTINSHERRRELKKLLARDDP